MSIYDDTKAAMGVEPKYPSERDFTTYFGYAGGKALGTFPTIDAAKQAGAVTTEKTVDTKRYKAAQSAYHDWHATLVETWQNKMFDEMDVSKRVFDVLYSKAYEDGHSLGHSNVENILMYDLADFAERLVEAFRADADELGTGA